MRRARFRLILATAVALAAAVAAPASSSPPLAAAETAPSAADARPNLLVFVVDDLDALTMPYWDALPKTARLVRDRGRVFANSFSVAPLSASSRAALLSGRYGHNNGVLTNHGDWGGYAPFAARGGAETTFAKHLQDAGYRTMHAGKYVPGYLPASEPVPPGWDEWYATDTRMYLGYDYVMNANGAVRSYGTSPADYVTDVLSGIAVDFARRSATDHPGQPWLMHVNTPAPHLPLQPALRHRDHPWKSAAVPKRPNYFEQDITDKTTWFRASTANRQRWFSYMDTDYRNRMGSLLAVDDMIAATLKALSETGQLGETHVVFTSDQGYNLGAHGAFGKILPYEESLQMPLVVAGPGVSPGVDRHMVTQIDLAPTLLGLAGLPTPPAMDGRSLLPLLRGEDPPDWRDSFLAEYKVDKHELNQSDYRQVGTFDNAPNWRAVRTGRYMLVQWWEAADFVGWPADLPGCCAPEFELYDLKTDPYQLTNLLATEAGRRQHATLFGVLYKRLGELAGCSGTTCSSPPSAPYAGSNPVTVPVGGRP